MNIFVDLDNTLAEYYDGMDIFEIGSPIESSIKKVRKWILDGHEVVIFTARLSLFLSETNSGFTKLPGYDKMVDTINKWCLKNIKETFYVTCVKWHIADMFVDDKFIKP